MTGKKVGVFEQRSMLCKISVIYVLLFFQKPSSLECAVQSSFLKTENKKNVS
jgi:hypothetical protein